jgi:hypothetical protein
MKCEQGNWIDYRERFKLEDADEIDLHFGRRERGGYGGPVISYDEAMGGVEDVVREGLRKAQEEGRAYVMFIHGSSTSRPGRMTARSVVRQFMRSKKATPFIVRSECIVHPTVFVARIR